LEFTAMTVLSKVEMAIGDPILELTKRLMQTRANKVNLGVGVY